MKLTGGGDLGGFAVICNGRRVPLTATGTPGEAVAGIRYRARRLNAALHPTIPVHTPLTFDLVDIRHNRTVSRCTYHAGPPDGTAHSERAADAAEARARRLERFVVETAPSSHATVPPAESNGVFPMTLDLRWPAPGVSPATSPQDDPRDDA